MPRFCRVVVDSSVLALDRPFDYVIPDRLAGRVQVGSVVRVPLHGRRIRGFVVQLPDVPAVENPSPLSALVSADPLFDPAELHLARWVADRYVTSLGAVLHDAVPGRFSAPEPRVGPMPRRTPRPAWMRPITGPMTIIVTPGAGDEPDALAHLVGETSARGKRSLIICPRVAVAERIAAAIDGAALLYGDQRPKDRASTWAGGRDGTIQVVVGGRAALLAPVADLGLVAVASAHDRSLKSERTPRLQALVVARERARRHGAAFAALSPSPPLDLVGDASFESPMRTERRRARTEVVRPHKGPVTPRLLEVVRWAVGRKTDALIFVGRLGGVLRIRCADCGWYPTCSRCGTGLGGDTAQAATLTCRMCSASIPTPDDCAMCGGAVHGRGWGHARVAASLEQAGLGAPVVPFVRGETPDAPPAPAVVVGTMAAAAWPRRFGAVCVADLDQLLGRPDFRAAENAHGLMHDLATLLEPDGRFLIQTREPEHHAVQAFTRRSFPYFAERELPLREEAGYPPFGAIVVVRGSDAACAELAASVRALGALAVGPLAERPGSARMLVRNPTLEPLLGPLRAIAKKHPRTKIDVDPVDVV